MKLGLYTNDKRTVVFAYHLDPTCYDEYCSSSDQKVLYVQVLPAKEDTFETSVQNFESRYPHPVIDIKLPTGPKTPHIKATSGLYTDGEAVVWVFHDALIYSFPFGAKTPESKQRNIHYRGVFPVASDYEHFISEESLFLSTFPYRVTELEFERS